MKVLVVEDDSDLGNAMHRALVGWGAETTWVTTLAAGIEALTRHPHPDHAAIYGVAGPVAASMSLVLGQIAQGNHQAQVRMAAMHEALDAQVLCDQTRQMASVSQALLKLQGTSHDAGTALSSVLFNLEQLAVEAHALAADDPKASSLSEIASRLVGSLDRLRQLLEEARHTGVRSRPNLELVNVADAVRATVAELEGRLSTVHITVRDALPTHGQTATRPVVPLYGGTTVLRRIVANLLTNAAEGNGTQRAKRIEVEVRTDEEPGSVTLRVSDDGPGFSSTLLDYPIRAFHSTKSGGTGLGLYTVGQLVAASGGSLASDASLRRCGPWRWCCLALPPFKPVAGGRQKARSQSIEIFEARRVDDAAAL